MEQVCHSLHVRHDSDDSCDGALASHCAAKCSGDMEPQPEGASPPTTASDLHVLQVGVTSQRRYSHGVAHLSYMVHQWKLMALRGVVQLWVVHRHLDVMRSTNAELDALAEGTTSLAHEVSFLSLLYCDSTELTRRQIVMLRKLALHRLGVRLLTRECCRVVHEWWQVMILAKHAEAQRKMTKMHTEAQRKLKQVTYQGLRLCGDDVCL